MIAAALASLLPGALMAWAGVEAFILATTGETS